MEYLGIAREEMKNFYDTCGCREDRKVRVRGKLEIKKMQKRIQLFIHSPWLAQRPEILGEKTRAAIRNGVLKVYDANEAVQHLTSAEVKASALNLQKILSKEDYEEFFGSLEEKKTSSKKRTQRKRSQTRKKAPRLQPSKVEHEPTTRTNQHENTEEVSEQKEPNQAILEETPPEEQTE